MGATANDLQAEVDRLHHNLQTVTVQHELATQDGDLITVSDYLLTRLEQLGITSIFGVPGDFNMRKSDYVEDHPRIQWVGNCNELNAAYAADGYARVKEGSVGVVVTTFGVGELSAINGIAGAFSEMVPVLHIVGVPSTLQLKTRPLLHHTLGDGRFDAYTKAAQQFTLTQASLMAKVNAPVEIDRVLTECITHSRPVYLTLPFDLVGEKVPAKRLKVPLLRTPPPNDPEVEAYVLAEIVKLVEEAGNDIVILVDACTIRHGVRAEVLDLVDETHFPVYAAPMGKTAVSEQHDCYGGIYIGSVTDPKIKEKVEGAKLILSIGALKSDFNTGMFTYRIPPTHTVELHSDHTLVRYAQFPGIGMKLLLPKLTARLRKYRRDTDRLTVPHYTPVMPQEADNRISHAYFWPRVGQFFKEKDIIVAETGTSSFGILDIPLPDKAIFLSQMLYGSIGWTVGSVLGATIAARDLELGRVILFVGDGSLQLTVQELSTMIHIGVTPIIFVLNNEGYNVERHLHGMDRKYNDIANWKYTSLLTTLGDVDGTASKSYTVRDKASLNRLLLDSEFARADKIQLVEVIMDKYDTPRALEAESALSALSTKKSSE
ncbi:thiamine diphosphate-binding protein [Pisolithus marmoratus]|nr:thiamine diphosphate-binding protein [Pisolithus marmoratus]